MYLSKTNVFPCESTPVSPPKKKKSIEIITISKNQGVSEPPKKVCASHGTKRAGCNKTTTPESDKMATECCEFGEV